MTLVALSEDACATCSSFKDSGQKERRQRRQERKGKKKEMSIVQDPGLWPSIFLQAHILKLVLV